MKYYLSIALLLVSCVTTDSPWIGQTANQLLLAKGAATSVTSDGAGGSIYVYDGREARVESEKILDRYGRVVAYKPGSGGGGMIEYFYAHADGTIYAYRGVFNP